MQTYKSGLQKITIRAIIKAMTINQGGKMERDQLSEPQNSEPISEQPQPDLPSENEIGAVQDTSLENFQININDGSVADVNKTEETVASEVVATEDSSDNISHQEDSKANSNAIPTQQVETVAGVVEHSNEATPLPKHKSKGTAIIITIIALCVLGVAALATWFFVVYNNPTKVVTDAISGLFSAENLSIQGDIYLEPTEVNSNNAVVKKVWLSFASNSRKLSPSSHDGVINLEFSSGDSLTLFFDYKIAKNHNIYIKLGALTEALEVVGISREDYPEATTLFDFVEMIDDEWWEITTDNIREFFGNDKLANAYNGYIDCTNEYINSAVRDKTFSKIYSEHSFLSVKNSDTANAEGSEGGVKWFSVGVNPNETANFINRVMQSEVTRRYSQCLADQLDVDYDDFDNTDNVTAADIKNTLQDDAQVALGINPWTHQLKYLTSYYPGTIDVNAKIEFHYEDIPYEDPESYRPISELISEFQDNAEEISLEFSLITDDLNGFGGAYDYEDYYNYEDDYYGYNYDYDYYYDYFGGELEN